MRISKNCTGTERKNSQQPAFCQAVGVKDFTDAPLLRVVQPIEIAVEQCTLEGEKDQETGGGE
jgi:hypothetical protein